MPFLKGPRHDRRRRRRAGLVSVGSYEQGDSLYARLWGPGTQLIDNLTNIRIGRPDSTDYIASYRFRATESSNITSIMVYFIDGAGYAAGDGGTVRCRIMPDDGTANHRPDLAGTAISTGSFSDFNMTGGEFPGSSLFEDIALTPASAAVKGAIYHAVFDNTDADPATNYISVDVMETKGSHGRPNRWLSPWDWGMLYAYRGTPFTGSFTWVEWTNATDGGVYAAPIAQITYANAEKQGYAAMETGNVDTGASPGDGNQYVWRPTASLPVRERFTPTTNRVAVGLSVHTAKESGSGGLGWELKQGTTVIASGLIADPGNTYSTVSDYGYAQGLYSWSDVLFASDARLEASTTYDLVFTPAGTSVWVFADQSGGGDYSYVFPAAFTQSYAQHWTGSAWLNNSHWDHTADGGTNQNWRVVLHLA